MAFTPMLKQSLAQGWPNPRGRHRRAERLVTDAGLDTSPPPRCQNHILLFKCAHLRCWIHSKMMWEQIYQCLDITDWLLHHIKKKKIQPFSLSCQQLPPRSPKERTTQVEHTGFQSSGQICDSAGNALLAGDSRQTGRQWQRWLQEQIRQRNLKVTPVAIQRERERGREEEKMTERLKNPTQNAGAQLVIPDTIQLISPRWKGKWRSL